MFHYINTLNEHSWVNQNVRKSSATSTQWKKIWKINKNSKYRFSFIICIIGKLHEHAFPNNFQMNARLIIQRNSGSKFHIWYTFWLNLIYPTLYFSSTHSKQNYIYYSKVEKLKLKTKNGRSKCFVLEFVSSKFWFRLHVIFFRSF